MPGIYAELIRRGVKRLEDVPDKIRPEVEALLADVESDMEGGK